MYQRIILSFLLIASTSFPGALPFAVTLSTKHIPDSTSRLFLDPSPALDSPPQPRKKKLKTFARFLEVEAWKRSEARDLAPVLRGIGETYHQMNRILQRAHIDDFYGVAVGNDGKQLDQNVQWDVQQKLDVLCNEIMLKQFCGSAKQVIEAVAKEEEDFHWGCGNVMVRSAAIHNINSNSCGGVSDVLYFFQKLWQNVSQKGLLVLICC